MTARTTRRTAHWAGLLLVLILLLTTACNYPAFAPTSTPTVISLPMASPSGVPTALPTRTPLPPTATAVPTATVKPTVPPTAAPSLTLSPAPKSAYRGLIVYDRASTNVTGVDFSGAALNIKLKLAGVQWLGFNQAQWANNSIYYLNPADKTINQVAANGAAQKLAFIPAKDDLAFAISRDGNQIAWSFDNFSGKNPASELWIAGIDGANAKQVAKVDPATNPKWLVLHPYRWLADGRLLYIDAPTGIGGYILFNGFAGLHLYDPANNKLTDLTPSLGGGGLCLQEISPDLKTIISACATSNNSDISYVNLADNKAVSLTHQTDQNQVGSPAWSPAGAWLAYAYARADAGNEQGYVALVASGATSPKILATLPKGYFNVLAWVDENRFLVQRYDGDTPSVWLFNRDGSAPLKLADGDYVGLVPD